MAPQPISTALTLQTGGPLTLSNIQTLLGGTDPVSLSEYRGAAAGVPASGPVSASQFYGRARGSPGLFFKVVGGNLGLNVSLPDQAFALDGSIAANLASITGATLGFVPTLGANNYTVEWTGYYYANATGNHTFFTTSNLNSFVWIGPTAVTGFTDANANVRNIAPGGFSRAVERSGVVSLTAGRYYNIRVQNGDGTSREQMQMSVQGPAGSFAKTTAIDSLLWCPNFLPADGLVGWYDGSTWSGTQWGDKSGAGNHATTTSTIAPRAMNNQTVLTGATNDSVLWPASILPPTYTLFHVTRYNGAVRNRIMGAYDTNWLSGHWNGLTGVAFHNGWLTQSSSARVTPSESWLVCADQNSLFRTLGNDVTTAAAGSPSHARLAINTSTVNQEPSDWAAAEVIVYDRTLTAYEINQVESYLFHRYRLGRLDAVAPREYPPAAMTAASSTINSQIWRANASSVSSAATPAFRAFDLNLDSVANSWVSGSQYDDTTGVYTGNLLTLGRMTVSTLFGFEGEWVSLEVPVASRLSTYTFTRMNHLHNAPVTWALLGSNSSASFYHIVDSVVDYAWPESERAVRQVPSGPYARSAYRFFRMVGQKLHSGTAFGCSELTLHSPVALGREYPPAAIETLITVTLNTTYGAGVYNTLASTGASSSWRAFSKSSLTWTSSHRYAMDTGEYFGTETTEVAGVQYQGEWIQIQMPLPIRLDSYAYTPSSSPSTLLNAMDWVFLGSNDGQTWSLLDAKTGYVWGIVPVTFNFPQATDAYAYYRMVAMKISVPAGGGDRQWSLTELRLFEGWSEG
jgi:hypothetical protein